MALRTRLTDFFDIRHPIILAPMDPAAGGPLAGAVSEGGGLGMIGGGCGNLVGFVLLPGQRFNTVGVEPLIKGLGFDAAVIVAKGLRQQQDRSRVKRARRQDRCAVRL